MSTKVIFRFLNHVFSKVEAEQSILQEIYDHFSFLAPGYKYHPKYKARVWDGQIHLFKWKEKRLYTGLSNQLFEFCSERDYQFEAEGFPWENLNYKDFQEIVKPLGIPEKFQPRDYQIESFWDCVWNKRRLLVSPTASGKSLIIYYILGFFNTKTLIVVPNTGLVHQMASDFQEYGYSEPIEKVFSGQPKVSNARIVIGTWQSLYKLPAEYFHKFGMIIGDECHHFKAKSLTELMEKTDSIPYRFGFTGSLDDTKAHKMVLEGLFGPAKQIVTSKDLMDQGHISNLEIKTILLKYPEEIRKAFTKKVPYNIEVEWLIQNPRRNKFIRNLALSLTGNTLILYRYVEKHGEILAKLVLEKSGDKPTFFISGKIAVAERDEIRKIINTYQDSITIASTGCFSEGVNIPNIDNIIFATPSKSRILVMQMIGRGLRLAEGKKSCTVFDIADDLSYKKRHNFTYNHYLKRIQYYLEEQFNFQEHKTNL